MHRLVTPSCRLLLLVGALSSSAVADTIHLKNGDVIYADDAKDTGTKIEYQKGDDTYSIPKTRVESIEKSGAPVSSSSSAYSAAADLQMPAPETPASTAAEGELLNQIVTGGQVNRDALRAIELRGNANQTAIAYYIAGKQEFQAGDFTSARRDFETALRNDPRNPTILNFYAALLVKTGNAQDGLLYAEHAVQQAPDSADAWAVLGYAQFATSHTREAIQSWKKSLSIRPDANIQQMLARAGRENSVENSYAERDSGHFNLHYEGSQSSDSLRSQILSTL